MTVRYARTPGVCLEPVGDLWAAFSPASGETLLMNDEGAAILEVLAEGPRSSLEVCKLISADVALDHSDVQRTIEPTWSRLVEAGLVQEQVQPS